MNNNYEYTLVRKCDKETLATLVNMAKGESRTMKEYADACGIDPSTLSRIVNRKNRGKSKIENIEKLAEHADPDSGVTLDMLLEANGYVSVQRKANTIEGIQAYLHQQKEIADSNMSECQKCLMNTTPNKDFNQEYLQFQYASMRAAVFQEICEYVDKIMQS